MLQCNMTMVMGIDRPAVKGLLCNAQNFWRARDAVWIACHANARRPRRRRLSIAFSHPRTASTSPLPAARAGEGGARKPQVCGRVRAGGSVVDHSGEWEQEHQSLAHGRCAVVACAVPLTFPACGWAPSSPAPLRGGERRFGTRSAKWARTTNRWEVTPQPQAPGPGARARRTCALRRPWPLGPPPWPACVRAGGRASRADWRGTSAPTA